MACERAEILAITETRLSTNSKCNLKLPEEAKKIEIFPKWMKKTNILQASFIILKILKLLMQKLKQASPGCHIINNLLTELARAVLGNIGPRSWQCGPSEAPRANTPQFGPRAP